MKNTKKVDLTEGPIWRQLILFAIPMFWGNLFQQCYNLADALIIGNFSSNDAFAAVSSAGNLTFLLIGFFNGISMGAGVVIARYVGAKEPEAIEKSIHTCFAMGIAASAAATVLGLLLVPRLLVWMGTPDSVLPESLTYFRIYFGGVATVIMYNICMGIMRAAGDSTHPLYYLILSSILNVVLDLILVAGLHLGVAGAAVATVFSQGVSCLLCIIQMCRLTDETRLIPAKIRFDSFMLKQIIRIGLPSGVQNSIISVGNVVVQANINSFGSAAMSGQGAYAKIEGLVFLPITCMAMALTTFISQNLGARKYDRAKKGAFFGTICAMTLAEIIGIVLLVASPVLLSLFIEEEESIAYGIIHARTVSLFFFLLAFSHCASGILRGCGKSFVPMITMLLFWCGVRVIYVTIAIQIVRKFQTISWAYPITWSLSSVVFLIFLLRTDWVHGFDEGTQKAQEKTV